MHFEKVELPMITSVLIYGIVQFVHWMLILYRLQFSSTLIALRLFGAHPLLPDSKVTGAFVGLAGSQEPH
jgi:hypothetical protein